MKGVNRIALLIIQLPDVNHEINIKSFFKIAVSAAKSWWIKDPFMQSAVIAYYAIFSIPGLLIMVISIAASFFSAGCHYSPSV